MRYRVRLPLQSLHLQELQLLSPEHPRLVTGGVLLRGEAHVRFGSKADMRNAAAIVRRHSQINLQGVKRIAT